MPTYNYECAACGHAFELFQSMTDKVKRKCPQCGQRKLERLIGTGAGLIFKGSGFYETDYRSSSYEAGKKKADSAEKGSAEKSSSEKSSGEKGGKKPKKKAGGDKSGN